MNESSPVVELVEKYCHGCETHTVQEISTLGSNDSMVLSIFHARATITICTVCGGSESYTEFLEALLLH